MNMGIISVFSIANISLFIISIIALIACLKLYRKKKKLIKDFFNRLDESHEISIDEMHLIERIYSGREMHALTEALPKLRGGTSGNPSLDKMDKFLQEADIDGQLEELKKGFLNFKCRDDMKVGIVERVVAEIFLSKKFYDLLEDKSSISPIVVGKVMSANIIGESFKITPLHSEKQIVHKKGKSVWKWDIKPLKKGVHKIILLFSIRLQIDSSTEAALDIPILEKHLKIKVNYSYSTKTFFTQNWQWLIGSVLGTGVVWAVLKLLKITT
jgi:hypothetical protein